MLASVFSLKTIEKQLSISMESHCNGIIFLGVIVNSLGILDFLNFVSVREPSSETRYPKWLVGV